MDLLTSVVELILLLYFYPTIECCKPNADGQFSSLELGSASNVTAVVGSDVYFICCGGLRWTYEDENEYTSREIGPHPYALIGSSKSPPNMNSDNSLATSVSGSSNTNVKDSGNSQNTIPTTVYTMHDDKGRLILRIDNVDMQDMGHYKCHGQTSSLDAYLVVANKNYPEEPRNKTLPNSGSMLPHYVMFSSDQLDNVKLICPLVGLQKVKSWLWREPVLPSSTEYAQLPQGRPPSRTVTAIKPGLHEGRHVEIGPDLSWARIVDPLSPEAPVKLWCQFVMPSPWAGKDPIVAYYEIDWELYEPISPQIYILPGDKELNFDENNQNFSKSILPNQQLTSQDQQAYNAYSINAQIDESIQVSNSKHQNKSILLLENKPARIACRFRSIPLAGIPNPQSNSLRLQTVYWYRNGQSVHVPPFYVDNSLITPYGLSILSVRAYPTMFNFSQISNEEKLSFTGIDKYKLPTEHLTCSVISQVKETPIYRVTTNASLQTEIILVPRIIHTELLSAERRLEDAIKLTCTTMANGPPNMRIDFASTDKPSTSNGLTQWKPLKSRYGLNIRPRQVDPNNPIIHRLVIDISDLKRSDHGVYRCTVWNQAGETQAIGHVLVHSEPQLELTSFGHNYFLGHKPWKASCIVKGYPLSGQYLYNASNAFNQQMNHDNFMETSDSVSSKQNINYDGVSEFKQKTDINQLLHTNTTSVRMKIFNIEGEPLDRVEINQIDYKSGKFTGINATYEVHMNQRYGREAIVRCEYTHTDNRTIYREIFLREATKPTAPNITVLCTGPRAIVFGITNPKLKPDNMPTERIVTQKVIFAPANTFHLSSTLASLSVYLDSEGQPSASPANDNDPLDKTILTSISAQPQTAVVPVKGLIPDTEYVFEWSSGNEFGLSVMIQFTLWTKKLETAPTIKNIVFLSPTSQYLRFYTFLGDPCPYEGGARPELSDLLVRYRLAKSNSTYDPTQLIGYGDWSDVEVCKNLATTSAIGINYADNNDNSNNNVNDNFSTEEDEYTGIKWAGDNPIPCEIPIPNTQAIYEIEVATRNRFEKSEWFKTFYRPNAVVSAASFCYPKCSAILCHYSNELIITLLFLCILIN
ncbi:broad minded [Schistosoma japonicum]|nr:broad minded [Schistosoma japonicum]